jgi:hypothetical protein
MLLSEYTQSERLLDFLGESKLFTDRLVFKDWADRHGWPIVPTLLAGAGYIIRNGRTREFVTGTEHYIEEVYPGPAIRFWVFQGRPIIVQTVDKGVQNYNWINTNYDPCSVDIRFKSGEALVRSPELVEMSREIAAEVPLPFVQVSWILTPWGQNLLTSIAPYPRVVARKKCFNPKMDILLGRFLG